MNKVDRPNGALARNVRRIGHLDLPGAGQVNIAGSYAYVGHIPNKQQLGTSIVDIADPTNPRLVGTVTLDDPTSHSHKVRVAGDIMVVNHERNMTPAGRRAQDMPAIRRGLREALGRDPTRAELLQKLNLTDADLVAIEKDEAQPYRNGGFRIYDIADRTKPKLIHHQLTGGGGVHRFDMDERYAYISTEMEGFLGAMLVTYDMRDPQRPQEVSRWWLPGQNSAAGEKPSWSGKRHRLHHALRFGDEMFASCWHGGIRVVDVSDISKPKTVASYNYHPPFPEPTHTFMPVPGKIGGKRIALSIDEEDQAQSANEERVAARPVACRHFAVRHIRLRRGEAAVAVRGERTRLAVRPHPGRAVRRASVPRGDDGHAGLRRMVRRRLAHYRCRRSNGAARGGLFHSRSGRRAQSAAEQ